MRGDVSFKEAWYVPVGGDTSFGEGYVLWKQV